jgi:outer membrane protein assembly factor BamB
MAELNEEKFRQFLYNLSPESFENFVARLWSERGWNANVTQISGDSGIDIVATKESPFQQKQLIQAKRYGPETTVGSPDIQQYASLRQQENNVDSVVVVTSSGFSKQAIQLAEKLNVKLISGKQLHTLVLENELCDLIDEFRGQSRIEPASRNVDVDPSNTDVELSSSDNPFSSAASVDQTWEFKTDGLYKSPTIAGDTIYIGGGDGFLYALEIGAGVERWKVNLESHFRSSPTVGEKAIYIGDVNGNVYALDRSEQTALWKFQTEGQVVSIIDGRETVYLKSEHWPHSSVHALNPETGEEYWSFEIDGTGENVHAELVLNDGVLYFGSEEKLHAVEAETGEHLWQFKTARIDTTPAVVDRRVYFGSWDQRLYALDATNGTEIWSFETGGAVNSSPSVVEGTVYFGSNDLKVYALNAKTGTDSWSFKAGGIVPTAPAVSNGHVYVACWNGTLYAVSADEGEKVWTFDAGGDLLSPTIRANDIYVGTSSGNVFALRESM